MVIGNKMDTEDRKILPEDAKHLTWSHLNDTMLYQEISAKTGEGVSEMFSKI